MSLASLRAQDGTMTWLGVGNVEAVLLCQQSSSSFKPESLIACRGVVGYRLPALKPSVLHLRPGDLAVFATDGVHSDFSIGLLPLGPPQRIAERILAAHDKGTDDALVLVVRYLAGR